MESFCLLTEMPVEVQDAEAVEEEIPWNWETEVRVDVEPVFIAVSSRSREAALLRSSASFCWTCARASDKSISTFLIRAEKCEVVEIYKKGAGEELILFRFSLVSPFVPFVMTCSAPSLSLLSVQDED
ncbi:hypothetical protein WR25_27281 [Diploscapter pachys]|uniref:Uncharacterized protein n=1 Tax=Diploscapter pachys TaxID=2018661 RepID=A0A2A2JHN8_9BILA|nr:hypothetical protein WR25_27281 [Diploscapter pachys]